jgi:hypothetical protein
MQKIGKGSAKIVRGTHSRRPMNKKDVYEDKNSRFDSLVARYYPAVYSSRARLMDDPRQAVASHAKRSMGRASNCKAYVVKRRLRRSLLLQFYVRDLRLPNPTFITSGAVKPALAIVANVLRVGGHLLERMNLRRAEPEMMATA